MINSEIRISREWIIDRDEFYEIDPLDNSINRDRKFNDLFCQEDLLWLKKSDFNIDLGWYGGNSKGHFGLYLFKGKDWHNCQLFEKIQTNNYQLIIQMINKIITDIDTGKYEFASTEYKSIDEYSDFSILSVLKK